MVDMVLEVKGKSSYVECPLFHRPDVLVGRTIWL